ncbi:MAG: transcription initiation factor IIB [Thermoproteota archaeon]
MLEKENKMGQGILQGCPECGRSNLIQGYDTGEIICGGCGLVVRDQLMDKGPEWRAFTKQETMERSRVGLPISYSLFDKGLSTSIGDVNRDAHGRRLPLRTRVQMWRLRKWHITSRIHSSMNRNLSQALSELARLSDKTSIPPSVTEEAAVIYRKVLNKGLVRGRSIVAFAAASLYAACRKTETARTLSEISEASLTDKKSIASCYRLLLRELNMRMPLPSPITYLSKIAETTGISGEDQGCAIHILREAERKRFTAGKDPIGLAAAALYIACLKSGGDTTQKEIADVAGVTEVTIRNRYKSLKKLLNLEIPD